MFFSSIVLLSAVCSINSYVTSPGIVPLDDVTFEKVLCQHTACLVIFHQKYAVQKEYQKLAKLISSNPDILMGELGTSDWGETENHETRRKYNVSLQDYPAILLFAKGNLQNPIKFHGKVTAQKISAWIEKEIGLVIETGSPLQKIQIIMKHFLKAILESTLNVENFNSIIGEAGELMVKIIPESDKKFAVLYVNIMKKIELKGLQYISNEQARVKGLLIKGKLNEEKKLTFQRKLDVLKLFGTFLQTLKE